MRCLLASSWFDDARIPHFVQELDNYIVLLDADTVEMSSHNLREIILGLAPELRLSRHRGGPSADMGL
jgi:hypothetical protein